MTPIAAARTSRNLAPGTAPANVILSQNLDHYVLRGDGSGGFMRQSYKVSEGICQRNDGKVFRATREELTQKGKANDAMTAAAKSAGREPEGLWMPGSLRELEDAILEGRIRIKRNPVVISAMMSAVTDEDRWGNYWLAKERAVNKIDCAVALAMAVGAACSYEGGGSQFVTGRVLAL